MDASAGLVKHRNTRQAANEMLSFSSHDWNDSGSHHEQVAGETRSRGGPIFTGKRLLSDALLTYF